MSEQWTGPLEDWRIDWATYGGPYIRYPGWPHPENGHTIAKLHQKKKRTSLIRSAHDLYEALAALIPEEMEFHMRETPGDFTPEWHNALDALRKARGEP